MTKVSRQVAWQQRQRALGRCYRCGEKLDTKLKSCRDCLEREYERRRRLVVDKQKSEGVK